MRVGSSSSSSKSCNKSESDSTVESFSGCTGPCSESGPISVVVEVTKVTRGGDLVRGIWVDIGCEVSVDVGIGTVGVNVTRGLFICSE